MTATVDCVRCEGLGMILDLTDEAGNDYYRPCPACRPEAHDRFLSGHLDSGHDCPSCQARRKGRPEPKPEEKPSPVYSPPARDFTEPMPRFPEGEF